MKILFILGGLNKGGAERVVCNLSNYFVSTNNDVTLMITRNDGIKYKIDNRIEIFSLDNNHTDNFFKANIKRLNKMKRKIKEDAPDIILSFLQEPTARILILKLLCPTIKKIPLIISVRISPEKAFNTIKRKLVLPLYNLANGFVFQTSEAQSYFKKSIQKKSCIIPNPIDSQFFDNGYKGFNSKEIISVGRLEKQKNYNLTLEAFSMFLMNNPDYALIIYGDGSELNNLKIKRNQLGLENKVIFGGIVDDIKSKLCNAKMFVISSDYEGLSNSLMEALALGIPCISTDSSGGGAKSLIKNNNNGILIPTGNKLELVNAMEKIANNEKIAMNLSKNAAKSMKKYNTNIVNTQWKNYIISIVKVKNEKE